MDRRSEPYHDEEGGAAKDMSRATVRPETRVRVPPHVVHRDFPTQTVVLNLDTGQYHGLNRTAGMMFAALQTAQSIAAAAKRVAADAHMPLDVVERDLCQLSSSLLERGLIEPADADNSRPSRAE